MESILDSIKKMIGPSASYDYFDDELIMHINSVFMILNQLGVGPKQGFFIEDDSAVWTDYLTDPYKLQAVKTYMKQKTMLVFDPPTNSTVLNAMNESIKEFESRLNIAAETPTDGEEE